MKKIALRIFLMGAFLNLPACTGLPEGIQPVRNFELNRYLGTWYEIARLNHSFEKGLDQVTAQYSMREDGGVKVVNRGFSGEEGIWDEAEGKAYFVKEDTKGYLKVSFFGPFYGSYVIFELDENYQYAFVVGPDRSYLWLLAREPHVDNALKEHFVEKAKTLGFHLDELIWVTQN